MIVQLFKKHNPNHLLLIPLLAIISWLPSFLDMHHHLFLFDSYQTIWYGGIVNIIRIGFWGSFLALFLIIGQAFYIVSMGTNYILYDARTYLPGFFFVLASACFPEVQRFNPVLFANIFLLIALDKLFDSYKKEGVSFLFFEAALLISIGSFFYPNLIFFLFFLWTSLIILRPFNWREWVFTLIGMAMPYILWAGYYFVMGKNVPEYFQQLWRNITVSIPGWNYFKIINYILYSFLALLIIISSYIYLSQFYTKKVQTRKFFLVLFWLFLNCIGILFFVPSAYAEMLFIIAIPVSYLLSYYFVQAKKIVWSEALVFLFMLLIFIMQYQHIQKG